MFVLKGGRIPERTLKATFDFYSGGWNLLTENEGIKISSNNGLKEKIIKLIEAMGEACNFSIPEISKELDIQEQTLRVYIQRLREENFIERVGRGMYKKVKKGKDSIKINYHIDQNIFSIPEN